MEKKVFKVVGTSITSPIDNPKRKEVLLQAPKMFSQRIDLSDFIGMDPDTKRAVTSVPYEVRTEDGQVLLKGKTDELGDTDRVFTKNSETLVLYVGDGDWSLGIDCTHEQ